MIRNLYYPNVRLVHMKGDRTGSVGIRRLERYVIGWITGGKAIISVDGIAHEAEEGDMLLLSPGINVEVRSSGAAPLQWTAAMFSCVSIARQSGEWKLLREPQPLDGFASIPGVLADVAIKARMSSLLQASGITELRHELHKLINALLPILKSGSGQGANAGVGMDAVRDYTARNYNKEITVAQLADMAGLSINHFIRQFKRQMDMTPTAYVQKLRMAKAKQLLFAGGKIKDVAGLVGYGDEHYFSRQFKKIEGTAPSLYMRNTSHRLAAMYYGLDDCLLTLGVRPVAALSYAERVSYCHEVPELRAQALDGVQLFSSKMNYEKLKQISPDLILTSDRLERDELLNGIAPTAVLKHTDDLEARLLQLADVLGRQTQADRWIDQYRESQKKMRQRLAERWGRQTACYVRISSGFWRAYGSANQTGALLYDDMGLRMPAAFPKSQKWTTATELTDLLRYDADCLIVSVDPTEQAGLRFKTMMQSEEWASLRAVRQGRVFQASDLLFKTLGPAGRLWALRQLGHRIINGQGDFVHLDKGI